MPPLAEYSVTPLAAALEEPRVMLPAYVTVPVVLSPPRVAVPVLPDCSRMLRPIVTPAVSISSAAETAPLVLPTSTAEEALPKAPALPLGALAETMRVPPRMEVVPV